MQKIKKCSVRVLGVSGNTASVVIDGHTQTVVRENGQCYLTTTGERIVLPIVSSRR